jgi:alkanesulfonate monooxygenase SsuD/methylene tetrahydromethanopterin reductase-like flavin-dependent oxidoreductase (luciferase family)
MLIRHLWLDTSDEAARASYGPFVEPIYRYYHRTGALGPSPGVEAHELKLGGALDDRVICGSPETVTDRLVAVMRDTSAEGCVFALRHPSGPPSSAVVEAISGLASDVLPAVRRRLAPASAHDAEAAPTVASD